MNDDEHTYLVDSEAEQEMARLALQGELTTQAVGLLPPKIDIFHLSSTREWPRVLDIGCAGGEWGLALVEKYRQIDLVGLDISRRMIAYARQQAEIRELSHLASFQVGNALHSLPFPANTFDLIHLRLAMGFIPRDRWLGVFQEIWRVLKPQGFLVNTESDVGATTYENPATAQLLKWLAESLWVAGLGFWDGFGSTGGIHAMQPAFFLKTGFKEITIDPHLIYASFGSDTYSAWKSALPLMIRMAEPIILGKLHIAREVFEEICSESIIEREKDTYNNFSLFNTVTGKKVVNE